MKIFKTKKYNILSNILKYSFVVVFTFITFSSVVMAQSDGPTGGVGQMTVKTKIENPLGKGNLETIPDFIKALVDIVLVVGIPIVALAIIYTGFLFVSAQGNSEKLTKAKKALVYTLIGAALLLGAFVIAGAIGSTIAEITKP